MSTDIIHKSDTPDDGGWMDDGRAKGVPCVADNFRSRGTTDSGGEVTEKSRSAGNQTRRLGQHEQ